MKKRKAKDGAPEVHEDPNPLNLKEEIFCREFIIDLNAAAAAARAGYSVKTAKQQAWRLMDRPVVRDMVRKLIEERRLRLQVDADNVIKEIAVVAFSNMRHYAAWSNRTITLTDSVNVDGRAVKSVKQTAEGIGIQLHNKTTALEVLARHFGLVGDLAAGSELDSYKQVLQEIHKNRVPKPIKT
jgi:phage terminase small subunit